MASNRTRKQWPLTTSETITSFESWKNNLVYGLSLDPNFAPFLAPGATWQKQSRGVENRGLVADGEDVPEAQRKTAAQKAAILDMLLGQIANFCPIIARSRICKASVSLNDIWQTIRLHFGFQSTGGYFLDIANIKLEPNEKPEDLYQRLCAAVEDSMLTAAGPITHHGEAMTADEELTPSLENFIVLTWLKLIHPDLPALIKQRYGPELRNKTLASIKPEISLALSSLLDELRSTEDIRTLRLTQNRQPYRKYPSTRPQGSKTKFKTNSNTKSSPATCPLCEQNTFWRDGTSIIRQALSPPASPNRSPPDSPSSSRSTEGFDGLEGAEGGDPGAGGSGIEFSDSDSEED